MTTLISQSLKAIEGFEHCIEHNQIKTKLAEASGTASYCFIKINSSTEEKKRIHVAAIVAILEIAQSRIKMSHPDGSKIELPVDPREENQPYMGFTRSVPIIEIPDHDFGVTYSLTEEEGICFYWNSQLHEIDSFKDFFKLMRDNIYCISLENIDDEYLWEVCYRKKNSEMQLEPMNWLPAYQTRGLTRLELHTCVKKGEFYFCIKMKKGLFKPIFDKPLKKVLIIHNTNLPSDFIKLNGYRSDDGIICYKLLNNDEIVTGNQQAILEFVKKMRDQFILEADPLLDQCVKYIAKATANSPSSKRELKNILPHELYELIDTYDPAVIKV